MDTISHVLRLARLEATVDTRCLLADSTRMEIDTRGTRVAPFHLVLEGETSLQVTGRTLAMRAGDVVLFTGSSPHQFTTPGSGPVRGVTTTPGRSFTTARTEVAEGDHGERTLELLCGHYTYGPGAGAILFRSLPEAVHVSLTQDGQGTPGNETVRLLSSLIRLEAQNDGVGSAAILSALCNALLAMVLRTATGTLTEAAVWTAASDEDIAGVIEAIIREPGSDWSLARLAKMTQLSRATLIRRFTRGTGMTVGSFIMYARLMAAADLLTESNLTVAEIAASVGYRSESTFSRAFRIELGLTPARFRKAHKFTA